MRTDPTAQLLLAFLSSAAGQAIIETSLLLTPVQKSALTGLPDLVNATWVRFDSFRSELGSETFAPLVARGQGLMCCSLRAATRTLWLIGTLSGVLAGLLAAVATAGAVQELRRRAVVSMDGSGILGRGQFLTPYATWGWRRGPKAAINSPVGVPAPEGVATPLRGSEVDGATGRPSATAADS